MSQEGLAVSEVNLDNGTVSFDGLTWPCAFDILGQILSAAVTLWKKTNNTTTFNWFNRDMAAVALETKFSYTATDPAVEGKGIFLQKRYSRDELCSWPGNPLPIKIGRLSDSVFHPPNSPENQ